MCKNEQFDPISASKVLSSDEKIEDILILRAQILKGY